METGVGLYGKPSNQAIQGIDHTIQGIDHTIQWIDQPDQIKQFSGSIREISAIQSCIKAVRRSYVAFCIERLFFLCV